MRRIKRNTEDIPQILVSPNCLDNLHKAIESKGEIGTSNYYYKHNEIINRLRSLYFDKCAYCEATLHGVEIDHYRPTNAVNENKEHPGYYWLKYEWTNLFPTCNHCNAKLKRTHFPVLNNYVTRPPKINDLKFIPENKINSAYLNKEEPLLVNPELHDPYDHLYFNSNFDFVSKTIKGKKTIEILFPPTKVIGLKIEFLKIFENEKDLINLLFYRLIYSDNNTDEVPAFPLKKIEQIINLQIKFVKNRTINEEELTFSFFRRFLDKNYHLVIHSLIELYGKKDFKSKILISCFIKNFGKFPSKVELN